MNSRILAEKAREFREEREVVFHLMNPKCTFYHCVYIQIEVKWNQLQDESLASQLE